MPPLRKLIRPSFLALIFALSTGLLAYAWWLFQIDRGNQALKQGDLAQAERIYAAAEAPFHRLPLLAQAVKDDYQKLVFNRVGILYAKGDTDEAIDKLDEAARRAPFLVESGEFSFWTGNLLLRRALETKDPEESVKNLKAALGEYQKGLMAQPEDWDLKYNYELLKSVLTSKERDAKEQGEKVKSILDKMRPALEQSRETLPPEKKG